MNQRLQQLLSRRGFLGLSIGGAASVVGAALLGQGAQAQDATPVPTTMPGMNHTGDSSGHTRMSQMLVGSVDHERNGFDPMQMLVDWDYGTINGETEDGRPIRQYDISAGDIEIEIGSGKRELYCRSTVARGSVQSHRTEFERGSGTAIWELVRLRFTSKRPREM
jgi:hypothetical protein